jgi:3-deoxy-D-manno-octulosonic-acid transferase
VAQRKIGYFFYNTFLALSGLLLSPVIIYRVITGFSSVGTIFKRNKPLTVKPALWIHAATEEQLAVLAYILPGLTALFADYRTVLTYTGKNAVCADKPPAPDIIFFPLPYSMEFWGRKILAQFNPQLLLLIEDPFYPNLVRHAKAAGTKIVLIGGRVNRRLSLVYRMAPQFLKSVFEGIDLLIMNSVAEANRIGSMGAALAGILVSPAVGGGDDEWEDSAKPKDDHSLKQTVGAIGTLLGRGF